MTEALYADPELVSFYDLENGWADDTRFCAALAEEAGSVLDLGCGTGLLLAGLDARKRRAGVDPAAAMLAVAKARTGGTGVNWIEGDVCGIRLAERFDLVVMTGHAFQCLLTGEARRQACRSIAAHLAPGGRFIFDSRNPARREWLEWTPEASRREIVHPQFGRCTAWNDIAFDARHSIATYETVYEQQATGRRWQASARIAFPSRGEIHEALAEARLQVADWTGNWQGAAWHEDAPEIIATGRLA